MHVEPLYSNLPSAALASTSISSTCKRWYKYRCDVMYCRCHVMYCRCDVMYWRCDVMYIRCDVLYCRCDVMHCRCSPWPRCPPATRRRAGRWWGSRQRAGPAPPRTGRSGWPPGRPPTRIQNINTLATLSEMWPTFYFVATFISCPNVFVCLFIKLVKLLANCLLTVC